MSYYRNVPFKTAYYTDKNGTTYKIFGNKVHKDEKTGKHICILKSKVVEKNNK